MNKTLRHVASLAGLAAAALVMPHASRAQAPAPGEISYIIPLEEPYSPDLFAKMAKECREDLHGTPGTVFDTRTPGGEAAKVLPCLPPPPRTGFLIPQQTPDGRKYVVSVARVDYIARVLPVDGQEKNDSTSGKKIIGLAQPKPFTPPAYDPLKDRCEKLGGELKPGGNASMPMGLRDEDGLEIPAGLPSMKFPCLPKNSGEKLGPLQDQSGQEVKDADELDFYFPIPMRRMTPSPHRQPAPQQLPGQGDTRIFDI